MIIQIINNKIINKIMHFNNKKHKIEDKDNNNNKVHLVLQHFKEEVFKLVDVIKK